MLEHVLIIGTVFYVCQVELDFDRMEKYHQHYILVEYEFYLYLDCLVSSKS